MGAVRQLPATFSRQSDVLAPVRRMKASVIEPLNPLTIHRLVASTIVNPVKLITQRALPHILKKFLKNTPPFTHANSSTAPIFKSSPFRVSATLDHVAPTSISPAMIQTMPSRAFTATRLASPIL